MNIQLTFDTMTLNATLNDSPVAKKLYEELPRTIDLITWGDEAYGSLGVDLGAHDPVPKIPGGGIAFTNNGNYLCFFYGQRPAWAVEYIGNMDNEWTTLIENPPCRVTIEKA